jgi:hypothetical protein
MRKITSVVERCNTIATFRRIAVWAMETTARWTPITPEMEVKVTLGLHIWEYAQMADALGKRTFELRQPEHYTLPAAEAYEALMKDVAKTETTAGRIAAMYDGMIPGLITRFQNYIAATDPILDEPTVAIMERIVTDLQRQLKDIETLRGEVTLAKGAGAPIAAREKAIDTILAEQKVAA